MSYTAKSIDRVKGILAQYDNDSAPADLIADIMHYCQDNELDFDRLVNLAKRYVTSDKEADATDS